MGKDRGKGSNVARIRNIKPEFFLHDDLFDLEAKTGLPVRLAFIGLWTQADREGRFRWQPRRLKASILPYDNTDFEQILKALCDAGFIRFYRVENEPFGIIPNFAKHQYITKREPDSTIPEPSEYETSPIPVSDQSSTSPMDIGHRTKDIGHRTKDRGRGKREAACAAPVSGTAQDELPSELDTPKFREAWEIFKQHRSEIKKPLTPTSTKERLQECLKLGEAKAIEAIRYSVANGWQGIWEKNGRGHPKENTVRREGVVYDPNSKVNRDF